MGMDLSKLTPEPWEADESWVVGPGEVGTVRERPGFAKFESEYRNDDASFTALARNAFGVMMRRGWYAIPALGGRWSVASKTVMDSPYDDGGGTGPDYADPFTALVEADMWYREHVEGKSTADRSAVDGGGV